MRALDGVGDAPMEPRYRTIVQDTTTGLGVNV